MTHERETNNPKAEAGSSPRVGQTRAKWLYGARSARFTTRVQLGRGGVHKISVDVTAEQLQEAARTLRERPDCAAFAYHGGIRRGKRGWQTVPVHVPRAMLIGIGIADALDGAVDATDAALRFGHWESLSTPRPCSSCREALDAHAARVDAARAQLVRAWTGELGVPPETLERLLSEFGNLPGWAVHAGPGDPAGAQVETAADG